MLPKSLPWYIFAAVFCPVLAEAHLVSGIVNGPDGPFGGAKVILQPGGQPQVEVLADINGEFAVNITSSSLDWIRPEPPGEGSGLIGERVEGGDIVGGHEYRLTLATEVNITGRIDVPEAFAGDLDVHLARLDKWDSGGGWGIDPGYNFSATVPAGVYTIQVWDDCMDSSYLGTRVCNTAESFNYLTVDATQGSVNGLVIGFPTRLDPLIDRYPPKASLISVGPADGGGVAAVIGAPGAVAGASELQIVNLHTGQFATGASLADGSFSIPMFAPPGAWLSISQDPTRLTWAGSRGATTIVQAPPPGTPGQGFATMSKPSPFLPSFLANSPSSQGLEDAGQIWISGELTDREWDRGEVVDLTGKLRIYSRNTADVDLDLVGFHGTLFLERVFSEQGKQELANPEFMSHVLTPTGLPIENRAKWAAIYDRITIAGINTDSWTKIADARLEATWSGGFQVPNNIPDGIYRLGFQLELDSSFWPLQGRHFEGVFSTISDKLFTVTGVGLVTVGSPATPKLSWALGLNDLSNGRRGTIAVEDRDRLQIAGRVASNATRFILPKENPKTSVPLIYRLEPWVPLMGASNRGWLTPPTIPFEFPSGWLQVQIMTPDGTIEDLGAVPLAQHYIQNVSGPAGNDVSGVSNDPTQYYGLTTLDPRFDISFSQYGLHRITMQGGINDIWGTTYPGGGTYEVWVARHLDIETGVYPHTPFEVGDAFAPTVIVQPGVAADVEIRITHYPNSDPAQKFEHRVEGQANRFGYFHPRPGDVFTFADPGEYRVEIIASYLDDEGVLWMGAEMWASVVETPGGPLIAHGQRNLDCSNGTQQQWVVATADNICGTHLTFPYHSGDIVWMRDTGVDPYFTAAIPAMTVQDTEGSFSDLVRARNAAHDSPFWELEDVISIGQIPLFSSRADGISPFWLPDAQNTHMAYLYAGASRPGVRIRDMVSGPDTGNAYWRFDDSYYYQTGNGFNGDLPNDFKFQFGGAVYRAPDMDFHYYGAYGSLWVLLPDDDPVGTRVMPPFQGNAGGPSGGPIMTLKGQPIDIFFHPTGTRAGSVLEVGDFASFSGQVGPPLPSQVSFTIVSPSGQQTHMDGQASKVGYFYDPGTDFRVMEPGNWQVFVSVSHNGQTSAGPTQEPFPSGSILGGNDFHFYVVERSSPPLQVSGPAENWLLPGLGPIGFDVQVPEGWTDLTVHRMTTMPGFKMEDRTLGDLHFEYDAPALAVDFPNLDLFDHDYRTGVDTITISFLLEGMENGNKVYRARQYLLQGEELMRPPQVRSETVFYSSFE